MKKVYRKATMKVLDVECEQQILSESGSGAAGGSGDAPEGVKLGSGWLGNWLDLG